MNYPLISGNNAVIKTAAFGKGWPYFEFVYFNVALLFSGYVLCTVCAILTIDFAPSRG